MASSRLLSTVTVPNGGKVNVRGARFVERDGRGRFIYKLDVRGGHWFAVTRVSSGWVVSEYEGDCDCT